MHGDPSNASSIDRSRAAIKEKTSALLAARAGVWDYDIAHDRLCYCRGAALAFGLPNEHRLDGIPISSLADVVHPEDQELYLSQVAPVLQSGGTINATFRISSDAGSSRRLLVRGDVVYGESGKDAHASGIVVDLSEEAAPRPGECDTSQAPGTVPSDLIAGIDHLIAARTYFVSLNEADAAGAIPLLDILLMDLGRGLARKLDAGDFE